MFHKMKNSWELAAQLNVFNPTELYIYLKMVKRTNFVSFIMIKNFKDQLNSDSKKELTGFLWLVELNDCIIFLLSCITTIRYLSCIIKMEAIKIIKSRSSNIYQLNVYLQYAFRSTELLYKYSICHESAGGVQ